MDGSALFRIHTGARTSVLTKMSEICLQKKRSRRLRLQRRKHTHHPNQVRPQATTVRRIRQRIEGAGKRRRKRAQQPQVDGPHQEKRRARSVESSRRLIHHQRQHRQTRDQYK